MSHGGEEGVLRDHSNWLALLRCPCQNLAQLIKSNKFTWNAWRLQIHVNRNSSSCFCLSLSHGHIKWLFDPPQMAMDGTYTYLQFVTFAADCKSWMKGSVSTGLHLRAGSRRSSPASLPGFAGCFHCFTSLNMSRRWTQNCLFFTKLRLLKNLKKTLF